ncbi:MAG: MobA/MobL family protein [Dorea sp.]
MNMWRQAWADIVNDKFREKGLECRIDHRSYVNQGLDLIPHSSRRTADSQNGEERHSYRKGRTEPLD